MDEIFSKIREFEKSHPQFAIAYGGDGTVLDCVEKTCGKKAIFPFRNYALCKKHEHCLEDFLAGKDGPDLKQTQCFFMKYELQLKNAIEKIFDRGIAEVVLKSANATEALRFNVHINSKLALMNVIADGVVIASRYGSTGYFKSLTRTMFTTDALGVAFIAPSQNVSNLVLDCTSKVRLELLRDADVSICVDKKQQQLKMSKGDSMQVVQIPESVALFGLEEFHCYECRKLRHSIVEAGVDLQDQYLI